jgi:hypothetical protein
MTLGSAGVDRVQAGESLDFNRVAKRVHEEHGPLLAWLARKAQVRCHHKPHARRLQPIGQGLPMVLLQNQAKWSPTWPVKVVLKGSPKCKEIW